MKRVILADDSQVYRESTLALLERLCKRETIDIEFDEVSDGRELVERVLSFGYDLVFTDNQMAEVSGLDAIQQIRAGGRTVPIYMISSSEAGQQAMALGATGYIGKDNYETFKLGLEAAVRRHLK